MSTISEADILNDVIGASEGNLTPDVAHSILQWKFTDQALERMNELTASNSRGTISDEEREELEKYLRVGSFINLVQAKARLSLHL